MSRMFEFTQRVERGQANRKYADEVDRLSYTGVRGLPGPG